MGVTAIPKTLSNVYWEMGFMQGIGKMVVLIVDSLDSLPSDFIRTHSYFYNEKGFSEKLAKSIGNIVKLSEYYSVAGEVAEEANNFEEAVKYFKDAYLISGDKKFIDKLKNISTLLLETTVERTDIKMIRTSLKSFIKQVEGLKP
jgi:hypothetical protein